MGRKAVVNVYVVRRNMPRNGFTTMSNATCASSPHAPVNLSWVVSPTRTPEGHRGGTKGHWVGASEGFLGGTRGAPAGHRRVTGRGNGLPQAALRGSGAALEGHRRGTAGEHRWRTRMSPEGIGAALDFVLEHWWVLSKILYPGVS